MLETAWVLARAYRTTRTAIADIIEGLLLARELVLSRRRSTTSRWPCTAPDLRITRTP